MISLLTRILPLFLNYNKLHLLLAYLILYASKNSKPELLYDPSKRPYIMRMKSLHKIHLPLIIIFNGFAQSLLQLYRPVGFLFKKSFNVDVSHGCTIVLDVTSRPSRKNVLLVHGFNGSGNSRYIQGLAYALDKEGYKIFCFNARGSKVPLKNEVFFHIGWTQDLEKAVEFILREYEGSLEIYGFSMGAAWVTKYLGERILDPRIIKAGAVCLPFDFFKLEQNSRENISHKVYNRMLTINFMRYIRRNIEAFRSAGIDVDKCFKCKSIREIDSLTTMKVFKFADIDTYYKEESCSQYIKHITIPFLILNSKDDPIIPHYLIEREECIRNRNILLVVNPWGGHLGFIKNSFAYSVADEIIIDFSKFFD